MSKFKDGNQTLNAAHAYAEGTEVGLAVAAAADATTKRELIYAAVRRQLENDNKRPWSLSQKLNDAPYRYTRDTLWAALNDISDRLAAGAPVVEFRTEGNFSHPSISTFAGFVNSQLTKTVSALINGIMDASRWRAQ